MLRKSFSIESRVEAVGSNLLRLVFLFGLMNLLLSGFRLVGLASLYFNDSLNFSTDLVGRSLFMGFRYDAKVIVIFLLPVILLSFFSALFPTDSFQRLFKKTFIGYGSFLALLFLIIETINFNYFQFFKTQLNVEVYGIFYDDTSALLSSIHSDYPLVTIFIGMLVAFTLFLFVISRLARLHFNKLDAKFYTLIILLVLPFIALAARGSFTTFPLQRADRSVSTNPYVNEFVMNGTYALIEAYKDLTSGEFYTDIDKILSVEGFSSIEECMASYPFPMGKVQSDSLFYYTSSIKPAGFKSPNVVVFFMEGMGTVFIQPNELEPENMGELYHQLQDCDLFLNAMPGGNITHASLENFILGTMDGPLSQSKYSSKLVSSSIAKTFKNAGYSTSFVSGGKLDWRNYGAFLRFQGFDSCEGMEMIKIHHPDAMQNEWGVFDEYLFDYVYEKLSEASPQFIFALTTTNHIPYSIPPNYALKNLDITPFKSYISSDSITFKRNLEVYQYAINQLGLFLKKIKESSYSENTIVVATGDHNVREALSYPPHWRHKNFAVPIIFRIPEAYQKGEADTTLWVSHRDMNNTICELALSGRNYFGSGINLYSPIPANYFAVHDYYLAVSHDGVSDRTNENNYSFTSPIWNGYLQENSSDEKLKNQMAALKAYRALVRISQANSLK
ncbi:MAG TPA: sulfatase-like hydrolase/transferase [Marinilabiliaceae bacterium]|nr:sulfatase-like hydrolase/transferase [Marinilabiliaceae bacterium]